MRRFNVSLLSLILVTLVTGCTQPDRGASGSDEVADFRVKRFKGGGAQGLINHKNPWKVPEHVKLGFTACLEERTSRQEFRNQPVAVYIPETGETQEHQTNPYGCFYYEEKLPYNYFAGKSAWIQLKHEIIGRGLHNGRVPVDIAVNPWTLGSEKRDSDINAVVYMRDGDEELKPSDHELIPNDRAKAFLMGEDEEQGEARLEAYNVKVRGIRTSEGCDGESEKEKAECWIGLRIEVELEPKIHTKNVITGDVREPIRDGDFDVYAQVLGADIGADVRKANTKVLLMSGDPVVIGHARDGKLKAEFKMVQKYRTIQGNLELALKVQPRSLDASHLKSKKRVKPFEGLFRLGAGTQLGDESGSLANECLEEKGCSYDNIVNAASNVAELKDRNKLYLRPNDPYVFSTMEFRFTSVLPGETATRRAVAYSASTCITDRFTGRPLADTPLKIRYLSIEETGKSEEQEDSKTTLTKQVRKPAQPLPADREVVTDESGCLRWASHIYHQYYMQEQYFEIKIAIERETGFKRDFTFYLNPWDDKFTFGWDERELDKNFFKIISDHAKPKSLFFLSDFGYHTVRFMYNIDRFMELEVKKTVLMEIEPRVLRYSGIINARKMTEHLRDGIYLMKVAIQKNYLDPRDNNRWMLQNTPSLQAQLVVKKGQTETPLVQREFVTTNMALVRVVDGVVIYPVELTMRDLRLMRVRANFLIQLETVDERLIQAFHVFKSKAIEETKIAEKADEYRRLNKDLSEYEARKKAAADLLGEELAAFKEEVSGLTEEQIRLKLAEKAGIKSEDVQVPEALKYLKDRRDEQAAMTERIHAFVDAREKVKDVQQYIQYQLVRLRNRLEEGGAIGRYLDDKNNEISVDYVLKQDALINDNFKLNDKILPQLKEKIGTNNFSNIGLPSREEIDLNYFVEKDSGLDRRTFVGPVIFLSNGYKDSVRATDNLDEACPGPDGKDALQETKELLGGQKSEMEVALRAYEERLLLQSVDPTNPLAPLDHKTKQRIVTPFNYDKYFGTSMYQHSGYRNDPSYGALTHLCRRHVDDLIKDQARLDHEWKQRFQAIALKYNFLTSFSFDLDYLSLASEKLTRVNEACLNNAGSRKNVEDCLETTTELTTTKPDVLRDLNKDLAIHSRGAIGSKLMHWVGSEAKDSTDNSEPQPPFRTEWKAEDLPKLFYERNLETRLGLCNLLANRVARNLKEHGLIREEFPAATGISSQCLDSDGLVQDIKLYVSSTGNYKFKGGLNLNINVGQSFSLSNGNSWSNGIELMDMLGPLMTGVAASGYLGGPMAAMATTSAVRYGMKSLGLKFGTSSSESEGTSVSESTYLVSQIAKFDVDLFSYERCAVVRLSDSAIRDLRGFLVGPMTGIDSSSPLTQRILQRGIMVCEGKVSTPTEPKRVSETYFYFTQHFTEGDMLDQAELYNHPWLLAMRGVRDFTMFVNKIRKQNGISLVDYNMRAINKGKSHKMAWALDYMGELYKNKLPSFPGFYTVLEPQEEINAFPLESGFQFRMEDPDLRGEVNRLRREGSPRVLSVEEQFGI